jgi:hypothetical protein
MSLNKLCDVFEGRYTCQHFIPNGACNRPNRFMCHVFIDTGKQPVEDDVPAELGMILETFPGSKVVKSTPKVEKATSNVDKKKKMEDFFGKI